MLLHRYKSRAFSLLEMAAATAILAATLVPALAVLRDSMAISRESATRALLTNYAVLKVEENAAIAIATWSEGTITEDFSSDGNPNIVSITSTSDDVIDGGIVDELMAVEVTVFEDLDGDTTVDNDEISISMRTKVAKLQSYVNEEQ